MFFSITHHPANNFSKHWTAGPIVINTDAGWRCVETSHGIVVYKGYADSAPLEHCLDQVLSESEPSLTGNFCVIEIDTQQQLIKIKTDRWRGFPIYIDQQSEITNLEKIGITAWADSVITADFGLTCTQHIFDVIGAVDSIPLSYQAVLESVDQILVNKISSWASHNTRPLKVFLSGGVDTLLVYSYVKRLAIPHEVVDYLHIDFDRFWRHNETALKKYWGYSQIHHWNSPTALASGAPGDEFMLRSPTTGNLYLRHHGTSIPEQQAQHAHCLHQDYFNRPNHKELFRQQDQTALKFDSDQSMHRHLCNIVINDWQHWHIGNTLTWSPLRDIEVFKLCLRMPVDSAIQQVIDSRLSRDLINRNVPGLDAIVSDQKNSDNPRKNLDLFF